MKVVAINGSARKDGNTALLTNVVLQELREENIESSLFQMSGEKIAGCIACYQCTKTKDGKCAVKTDRFNDYMERMREADGILLASPVYIADVTANMKALIERATIVCRANGSDLFKRKVGAGIIAARRAGALQAFNVLNDFFLINQMIIVGSNYWNIGLGRNAGEAKNDAEGVQVMKVLGINMAWLLKKMHP